MVLHEKLKINDGVRLVDPSSYRQLVGKLLYSTVSRPDISFAVRLLSQFMQNPTSSSLQTATHVLRYRKRSMGQQLFFPSSNNLTLHPF